MEQKEKKTKIVKAAKIGGAVLVAGAAAHYGLLSFQLPEWAIDMTRLWGPGFLMVATVFGAVAYYVPRGVVGEFVRAQQDQAVALAGIKDQMAVMAGQNGKLDELGGKMDEMLLHQRINGDRLKTIESRIYDVGRENDP